MIFCRKMISVSGFRHAPGDPGGSVDTIHGLLLLRTYCHHLLFCPCPCHSVFSCLGQNNKWPYWQWIRWMGDMAWQSRRDKYNHKHRTAFVILAIFFSSNCLRHPFFLLTITLFLFYPLSLSTLPSWTATHLKSQVSSTAWPLPPLDILCK